MSTAPLSSGGPVAMPWVQYIWLLRLRPGRNMLDPEQRERAAAVIESWLVRWERRGGGIVSRRSVAYAAAATGSLIVHFRALVLVPPELRGYVALEVNKAPPAPSPAAPKLERATAADVAALTRRLT